MIEQCPLSEIVQSGLSELQKYLLHHVKVSKPCEPLAEDATALDKAFDTLCRGGHSDIPFIDKTECMENRYGLLPAAWISISSRTCVDHERWQKDEDYRERWYAQRAFRTERYPEYRRKYRAACIAIDTAIKRLRIRELVYEDSYDLTPQGVGISRRLNSAAVKAAAE